MATPEQGAKRQRKQSIPATACLLAMILPVLAVKQGKTSKHEKTLCISTLKLSILVFHHFGGHLLSLPGFTFNFHFW